MSNSEISGRDEKRSPSFQNRMRYYAKNGEQTLGIPPFLIAPYLYSLYSLMAIDKPPAAVIELPAESDGLPINFEKLDAERSRVLLLIEECLKSGNKYEGPCGDLRKTTDGLKEVIDQYKVSAQLLNPQASKSILDHFEKYLSAIQQRDCWQRSGCSLAISKITPFRFFGHIVLRAYKANNPGIDIKGSVRESFLNKGNSLVELTQEYNISKMSSDENKSQLLAIRDWLLKLD